MSGRTAGAGRRPGARADGVGRSARGERGSVSVELVILVPGLVLILGLLLAGGRIWAARAATTDAAYAAARAGSLARSAGQAQTDGTGQGLASLEGADLGCTTRAVTVDTSGFARPVGSAATVTASVRCTVPLADLVVPGLPGSMTISADGAAALDTYRER